MAAYRSPYTTVAALARLSQATVSLLARLIQRGEAAAVS
jgi:hypothetical protein